VVLPEEYFHPQAEGAKVEKESCHGNVGADNRLVYELDNTKVSLILREYESSVGLSISLEVFEDSSVIWPNQVVDIYADNVKIQFEAENFTRWRYVNRYESSDIETKVYPVNTVMNRTDHDNSKRLTFREYYDSYSTSFEIPNQQINLLRIDTIKVIVMGTEHFLTDIIFTRKSGVFLHPLNC
jgi:hypothetical protein